MNSNLLGVYKVMGSTQQVLDAEIIKIHEGIPDISFEELTLADEIPNTFKLD
jgi:hypothetical protein